jgi:hypothetical protein
MRFLTKYISFTPTEFELIEDRLFGCPDAIAEALEIEQSVVEEITIHDRTKSKVTLCVPQGSYEALTDAIEGSTLLAKAKDAYEGGEIAYAKLHSLRRAAKTAAQKIRDAGIECGEAPAN